MRTSEAPWVLAQMLAQDCSAAVGRARHRSGPWSGANGTYLAASPPTRHAAAVTPSRLQVIGVACFSLTGCTGSHGPTPPRPALPVVKASSGAVVEPCASAAKLGAQVTGVLLQDGCEEADGTVTHIDAYFCRGTGDFVASYRDRLGTVLTGRFGTGDPLTFTRASLYGTWTSPSASGVTDCAAAFPPPPDSPDPTPSNS